LVDDHPITIAPAAGRVVARWRGHTVADSRRALELREADYPPVLYIPRDEADLHLLAPSPRKTICPYKGEASYFTLRDGDEVDGDAVWSYEAPKPGVAAIADHLAFYPDRVQIERRAAD